jgi:hypothetical protein
LVTYPIYNNSKRTVMHWRDHYHPDYSSVIHWKIYGWNKMSSRGRSPPPLVKSSMYKIYEWVKTVSPVLYHRKSSLWPLSVRLWNVVCCCVASVVIIIVNPSVFANSSFSPLVSVDSIPIYIIIQTSLRPTQQALPERYPMPLRPLPVCNMLTCRATDSSGRFPPPSLPHPPLNSCTCPTICWPEVSPVGSPGRPIWMICTCTIMHSTGPYRPSTLVNWASWVNCGSKITTLRGLCPPRFVPCATIPTLPLPPQRIQRTPPDWSRWYRTAADRCRKYGVIVAILASRHPELRLILINHIFTTKWSYPDSHGLVNVGYNYDGSDIQLKNCFHCISNCHLCYPLCET